MSAPTADYNSLDDIRVAVDKQASGQRLWFFAVISVIAAYMAFSWVQFDIGSLRDKWRPDRAAMFVLDTYANKDHVTMRWQDLDGIKVYF